MAKTRRPSKPGSPRCSKDCVCGDAHGISGFRHYQKFLVLVYTIDRRHSDNFGLTGAGRPLHDVDLITEFVSYRECIFLVDI